MIAPTPLPTPLSTPEPELHVLSQAEIDKLKASGLVEANNRFGWRLFQQIYQANPEKNLFMSPVSASFALQMALLGSDGMTLAQMKQTLEIEKIDTPDLLASIPLLLLKMQRPAKDVSLEIANSLWANYNTDFLPEFVNQMKDVFKAEVATLDFGKQESVDRINQWTSQATHEKIPKIIKEVAPETLGFLINAIYFKGKWSVPFDKAETIDKPFRLEDGTVKNVPMMRQFSYMPYLSPSEDFPYQGVSLSYGKEGKLSMYVFLPTTAKKLADLQKDLQKADFEKLRLRFHSEGGSLEFPRFKLQWDRILNAELAQLGMPLAFDQDRANFSKLAMYRRGENLYLSYVKQFSYLDVNEEGTEAAAVTVVAAATPQVSSEPQRTHSMIVDHPFAFLIRDNETGQILFMGSITDPLP